METNITQKSAYVSREEKNGITQELVRELFNYKDGLLFWKVPAANGKIKIGGRVGYMETGRNNDKRRRVRIKHNCYLNTRIIFLWHHGFLPEIVDHKDRNGLNDRIENLRAATKAQNCRNRNSKPNSSSQYLGVSYRKNSDRWYAATNINKRVIHLGTFKTEVEAALAYNETVLKLFGEFANLNIIKPQI